MKFTTCCFALIFLIGCGKPSETTSTDDTTHVALDANQNDTAEPTASDEEKINQASEQLKRFIVSFDESLDGRYPIINYTQENSGTDFNANFIFEDDNLIWMETDEIAKTGGETEYYYVNRDPEGTFYLHFGSKTDGVFGYSGITPGDWFTVKMNDDFEPYITGISSEKKFDWESKYKESLNIVRENKDKFVQKGSWYNYTYTKDDVTRNYRYLATLATSSLLTGLTINKEMIEPYVEVWYPLYEDKPGTMNRHQLCSGGEASISITNEDGKYRWEDEDNNGKEVYLIKAFEESEGDAFYATIDSSGHLVKKILIKPEATDYNDDLIIINGITHTNTPSKYELTKTNCVN